MNDIQPTVSHNFARLGFGTSASFLHFMTNPNTPSLGNDWIIFTCIKELRDWSSPFPKISIEVGLGIA
jgi:hypothetical protein